MRRLDGPGAFLVRSDRSRAYQHTLKIALIDFSRDPAGYRYENLLGQIQEGIEAYPHLKWKVATVPLGLSHPFWVQDLDFDISHHVRRIACPAGGDKSAFCALVSELYAQQLPRDLPLWIVWIVEGLENGEVAMVAMFHHAYSDGVGVSIMLEGLANPQKRPNVTSEQLGVDSRREPGSLSLLLHGLVGLPLLFLREIPYLVRHQFRSRKLRRAYLESGQDMPPRASSAPDSPFNVALSHRRTFFYASVDLPELKAIGKHFGVTINDLLVAAVCGAVRRFYLARALPMERALVASVPFSMRKEANKRDFIGNYIANSWLSLPIHLAEPLARLKYVQQSARSMKAYVEATDGGGMSYRAMELIPPLLVDFASWLLRRRRGRLHPFGNLAISNVPGPKAHMYVGKARVANWLSSGHLPESIGLNITAWSYVDRLNVCLMADRVAVPDGQQFMAYLEASIREYLELADLPESPARDGP